MTSSIACAAKYLRSASASGLSTARAREATSSLSVQRIKSLCQENGRSIAIFMPNTAEPELYHAIEGDGISGCAICPASMFMATVCIAARYLFDNVKMAVPLAHLERRGLRKT